MFEQPILNKEYFTNLTDSFRSPHIWKRVEDTWILRNAVYMPKK